MQKICRIFKKTETKWYTKSGYDVNIKPEWHIQVSKKEQKKDRKYSVFSS
jgi:hypothetical protein